MKRCLTSLMLVLATACAMLGQQATGDTAPTRQDILKLFEVTHVRDQMKQVMDSVMKQMKSMSREQMKKHAPAATDEDVARLDAMAAQLFKDMPIDGLLDDMIPVYQKHLDEDRCGRDGWVLLHTHGAEDLSEMPAITAEGMQAVQPRLRKIVDETTEKMEKMANEEAQKQNAPSSNTTQAVAGNHASSQTTHPHHPRRLGIPRRNQG